MPLTIQEHSAKTVSATLGSEALDKVLLAALIGVILVLVFMLVVYRFQGLVADFALFIYILIFYWFISQFPWLQLTLPSIAGIVLSIGMAVDANVVIFERIKDEFRAGRKLEDAVQTGIFKGFDGNYRRKRNNDHRRYCDGASVQPRSGAEFCSYAACGRYHFYDYRALYHQVAV